MQALVPELFRSSDQQAETACEHLTYPSLEFPNPNITRSSDEMENDQHHDDSSESTWTTISHPSAAASDHSDDERLFDDTGSGASFGDRSDVEETAHGMQTEQFPPFASEHESNLTASVSLANTVVNEKLTTPSLAASSHPVLKPTASFVQSIIEFDESDSVKPGEYYVGRYVVSCSTEDTTENATRIILHQTMSPAMLQLHGSLKLIYNGSPELRERIVQKIGQAIATSHEMYESRESSFRYLTVPMTSIWKGTRNPVVELVEATDPGIEVFDSTAYRILEHPIDNPDDLVFGALSILSESSEDQESAHGKPLRIIRRERLQLAIVVHASFDMMHDSWIQSRTLGRHGWPVIDLLDMSLRNIIGSKFQDAQPSDSMALYSTVTTKDEFNVESRTIMPINVESFLAIDAHQLNQHLAVLTDMVSEEETPSKTARSIRIWDPLRSTMMRGITECTRVIDIYQMGSLLGMVTASMVFLAIIGIVGNMFYSNASINQLQVNSSSTACTPPTAVVVTVTSPQSTSSRNNLKTIAIGTLQAEPVNKVTTISKILSCDQKAHLKSDQFDFGIWSNDTHLRVGTRKSSKTWQPTDNSTKIFQSTTEIPWVAILDRGLSTKSKRSYTFTVVLHNACEPITIELKRDDGCWAQYSQYVRLCAPRAWPVPQPHQRLLSSPTKLIKPKSIKNKAFALVESRALAVRAVTNQLIVYSNSALDEASVKVQNSAVGVRQSAAGLVRKIRNTDIQIFDPLSNPVHDVLPRIDEHFRQWSLGLKSYQNIVESQVRSQYAKLVMHVANHTKTTRKTLRLKLDVLATELNSRNQDLRTRLQTSRAMLHGLLAQPNTLPMPVKTARDRASVIMHTITGGKYPNRIKEARKKLEQSAKPEQPPSIQAWQEKLRSIISKGVMQK